MKTTLLVCGLTTMSLLSSSIFASELDDKLKPGLDAITPDGMLAHIKTLASDEFEGRAPGSKGEELSIKYISDQSKTIGLKPGNPDGTYFQEVPLAGITSDPHLTFAVAGKPPIELVEGELRAGQP